MSLNLKQTFDAFTDSVAKHLNALHNIINMNVSIETHNNLVNRIDNDLDEITNKLNENKNKLELLEGLKFVSKQDEQKIVLSNSNDDILSEIDVSFLNNEGTTLNFNSDTNELEIKNDDDELLSSIPVSNLITGIAVNLIFNPSKKYELQLLNNENSLISSVEIKSENIKDLQDKLDLIKSIYNSDGVINENRNITINESLKFLFNDNKEISFENGNILLNQIKSNNFTLTNNNTILQTLSENNLAKIFLGNSDINLLELNSVNYKLNNLRPKTNHNRTLCVDENGDLAFSEGIGYNYIAGEGIEIDGNVIKLAPQDSINLIFDW